MSPRQTAHAHVLSACAAALDGPLSGLADFLPTPLPGPDHYRDVEPEARSVINHLPESRHWTTPELSDVVEAVINGAPHFHWRSSYKPGDGIDEDFIARYGYFNIVSPDGPYLRHDYRITIAFWGAGLKYPEHNHEPEEMYALVAGDVEFRAEGRAPVQVGPGGLVRHGPHQLHATDMNPGPMLAVVGWKGENLMRFAKINRGTGA